MRTNQAKLASEHAALSRKDIRLPFQKYVGKQIYFVTICCHDGKPLFSDAKLANWAIENLLATARTASFSVHAYCVMPDHVHLLVEGLVENCDLLRFISLFKQKTGFTYKKTVGRHLWQSKYYDHILRHAEELESIAMYIWLNPVRKNLCIAPQEYAHSGS